MAELRRAYLADTSLVHSAPLCDIFKVATCHPDASSVPKMHADRIASWVNKRFFSVPSPNGQGPLLFVPSSATFDKYPDDADGVSDLMRHLVTVIPAGAAVQVSLVEPVTDAGTGLHYADHDLKRDLLIHCHDNGDHPSVFTTNANVRALAWFPGMWNYIQDHCDSCAYCLAKRKATTPVGNAMRCRRRRKLVEFDHKVLPKDVADATGYDAVLSVVDVVTRVTMFVPVTSVDAVTTARALFTR